MTTEYIQSTWKSLLDADLNTRYWRIMSLRYARRESIAKIFLAATASATVASWSLWADWRIIWQSLSVISALVSVALPIVDATRKIEVMNEAQTDWLRLMHEYEELWRMRELLTERSFPNKLSTLKSREVDISKKTAKLPSDDTALAIRCHDEVLKSRGLT